MIRRILRDVVGLAIAAAILIAVGMLLFPAKALAQFADQATWAGTAGGTANAITLAVSNWTANRPGVVLRFVPASDNTATTTVIVNGVGGALTITKPSNAGLVALAGGELRSGQPAMLMFYDATHPVLLNQLGQFSTIATLANSALSFGFATNLQLNATVSANALTIALKTNDGNNATATNPILVPFRSSTIANGDPKFVSITGALSFTINSGNTMGCVNNQMCRLWIVAICATGLSCTGSPGTDTVALCAINARSGTSIVPINEAALQTSQSGTTGGSSAQLYYCSTSAVAAKAIRILGYVDIKETAAGTWATGPTYTQLFGPGIKRPGDLVQATYSPFGTLVTLTTPYYTLSNTPPTTSFGAQITSQAITPSAEANILRVTAQVSYAVSGGTGASVIFLTQDAGAGSISVSQTNTSINMTTPISYEALAAQTTSTTFKLWIAIATNTAYVNGTTAAGSALGGLSNTFIRVEEIMSALPESANDNGDGLARMAA